MEEKKKALQVAMKPAGDNELKYTQEQMDAACRQVYQDMARRLQQADMANLVKRLEFLFKVLEFKDCFDQCFIVDCAKEIKEALTVPEEQGKTQEE